MEEYKTCQGYINLDKRVLVIETKMEGIESDISEIKQNQKEARLLTITTLISSLLGLGAIVFSIMGG